MSDAATAPETPAQTARRLIRTADRAALATRMRDDGSPYASLVLVAAAIDATPILLISQLAEHTRNLLADDRMSLLYNDAAGGGDPLNEARVSVQGHARPNDDPQMRERFLARHPSATTYAGFADFDIFTVQVTRAHLVAGFGRIDWIAAADLPGDT